MQSERTPSENVEGIDDLRKRVMAAICDPGHMVGFRNDRSTTEWQTDAVMRVLATQNAGTPAYSLDQLRAAYIAGYAGGNCLSGTLEGDDEWEEYFAAMYGDDKKPTARPYVDDETVILQRLADGDTIVFSQDGDQAWFTKGDRAFVGDAIMRLREKGFLSRRCDDDENYRGMSEYDTISDAGRAAIETEAGQ